MLVPYSKNHVVLRPFASTEPVRVADETDTPVASPVTAVGTVLWYRETTEGLDIANLRPHLPGVNSVIRDRSGRMLSRVASTQNRTPVKSSQISPWLKTATVAIEDRRFYQHGGVDYEATLRAFWANLTAGHVVQGGSTLEQQLAKLLYLDDSQTITRKAQEAAPAK